MNNMSGTMVPNEYVPMVKAIEGPRLTLQSFGKDEETSTDYFIFSGKPEESNTPLEALVRILKTSCIVSIITKDGKYQDHTTKPLEIKNVPDYIKTTVAELDSLYN